MVMLLRAKRFNRATEDTPRWLHRAEAAVDIAAPFLPARVVDLGCGDCKIATLLRRRGIAASYQGLDLDPANPSVGRIDLRTDAVPGCYDLAFCLGVLEYIPDLTSALTRIRQAAARLVVSHLSPELEPFPPDIVARCGWVHVLDQPAFERHLSAAGWRIRQTRLTPDRRSRLWLCEGDL